MSKFRPHVTLAVVRRVAADLLATYGPDHISASNGEGYVPMIVNLSPHSFVAHILVRMGVSALDLEEFEGSNVRYLADGARLFTFADDRVIEALSWVRRVERGGLPWGEINAGLWGQASTPPEVQRSVPELPPTVTWPA